MRFWGGLGDICETQRVLRIEKRRNVSNKMSWTFSKGRWIVSNAQISGICFPSGERKVPCVWFPKLDGISGASLPGKLAVLVRGDFCSASWKTTQDSTYMSDAFGRNVGESSAVSSGPLNDTEESSSPRADSTARLHQTERRGWGSPKRAHGCISLSRFIYNNWSDRATHERSRQHIVNGAHPISDHYIRLWIPHDIADITRSRINIYLDDLV